MAKFKDNPDEYEKSISHPFFDKQKELSSRFFDLMNDGIEQDDPEWMTISDLTRLTSWGAKKYSDIMTNNDLERYLDTIDHQGMVEEVRHGRPK